MTYPERMLELAVSLGYKLPGHISEHAFERWHERWVLPIVEATGMPMVPAVSRLMLRKEIKGAAIEGIAHKEKATIWRLPCDAKIVVSLAGTVMTVLPKGAQRTDRRPKKRGRRARRK